MQPQANTYSSSDNLDPQKILVVEDDPDISKLIKMQLQDQYKKVEIANDGNTGFKLATDFNWDLIILDLRLPGKDGLQLCRELRAEQNYVPILMLTSKSGELDHVIGLESGADDYVTKPFSMIELSARIRAIFRRMSANKSDEPTSNKLASPDQTIAMDLRSHQATKNGEPLDLTAKEFDLLSYFMQNPNSVFSRAHLLNCIWGYGHEGYEHTVNSHINRLRAKIEDDTNDPKLITTVWGVGYKFS